MGVRSSNEERRRAMMEANLVVEHAQAAGLMIFSLMNTPKGIPVHDVTGVLLGWARPGADLHLYIENPVNPDDRPDR